jgi:hypothetical protein
LAVAVDGGFAPFGKEVDAGEADAVDAAGDGVAAVVEFAACFELRHGEFDAGDTGFGVDVDGYAAAVVAYGDRVVDVEGDVDLGRTTGQDFVGAVVDDFVNEVMKAVRAGVADVHVRQASNMLKVVHVLDAVGGIGGDGSLHGLALTRHFGKPPDAGIGSFRGRDELVRLAVYGRFWTGKSTCTTAENSNIDAIIALYKMRR